ncbi:hypothetical protein [Nocardia abscessus]|uniref:hypothetical protein n=1 Tax=Nocardia abscessus TaxID=120957 RepID=UPI002456492D|nr:hypothetical protein [Nocardia abscessus]
MTDWPICATCGELHPTDAPAATLLLQYAKQNQHDGKLTPADAEALRRVANCVHAQLYAAIADVHNLQLELQRQRANATAASARPAEAVTDSGTQYAVCKRNGDIIESPALDVAVKRFDNMQAQAEDLGFECSGADVVRREWSLYTTDWATVPNDEIAAARAVVEQLSGPGPQPEF